MKLSDSDQRESVFSELRSRVSGRVGESRTAWMLREAGTPTFPNSSDKVYLYRRFLELCGSRVNELSKATSYGIKLLTSDGNSRRKTPNSKEASIDSTEN